jgi:hypothetical protein
MAEHSKDPEPEPKIPRLPKWFALRGPEPGWLASNWSLILACVSGLALVLNMILTQKLLPANWYNEITTIVAWLSTAALFLQSRQGHVNAIAEWRARTREAEALKTEDTEGD